MCIYHYFGALPSQLEKIRKYQTVIVSWYQDLEKKKKPNVEMTNQSSEEKWPSDRGCHLSWLPFGCTPLTLARHQMNGTLIAINSKLSKFAKLRLCMCVEIKFICALQPPLLLFCPPPDLHRLTLSEDGGGIRFAPCTIHTGRASKALSLVTFWNVHLSSFQFPIWNE